MVLWYNVLMKKINGFTLLELLVVIAIIGLLATTVNATLQSAREKARDTKRIADFKQIQKALQLYYDVNGEYPSQESYVITSFTNKTNWIPGLTPFLENLPVDPVNTGNCRIGLGYSPWDAPAVCGLDSNNFTCQYTSFDDNGQNNQDYNLIGQLENKNHELRCAVECWTFNTDNNAGRHNPPTPWCQTQPACGGAGNPFDPDIFSDHLKGGL